MAKVLRFVWWCVKQILLTALVVALSPLWVLLFALAWAVEDAWEKFSEYERSRRG